MTVSPASTDIPAPFTLLEPYGPFHELVGPLYETRRNGRIVIGMRVATKHRNKGPGMHGGMYFMLFDTAMTHASAQVRPENAIAVTSSFSSELIGAAAPGDWIEAEVEVLRTGKRVVFLNTVIRRDGQDGPALARGSATFQIVERRAA